MGRHAQPDRSTPRSIPTSPRSRPTSPSSTSTALRPLLPGEAALLPRRGRLSSSRRSEAVFTRTVADPLWGAKLTGKIGRTAMGFFAAQDAHHQPHLPLEPGLEQAVSLDE
ncbi:MAG: hypothetical protein MZV63_63005 [Marinilabiliales bacterium]|nr:hypothetical protein [Marinilabiliales bacterium]